MKTVAALLLLGLSAIGAQESSVSPGGAGNWQCPHEFGFYPHDTSCDKYYSCEASVATLKTCGNGLAFDDTDPEFLRENCDYSHNVDCTGRPQLEPPISTPHCPYLFGIFPDPDDCAVFWSCWDGEASRYACAPGLAYDRKSRVCNWMDNIAECKQQRAAMEQDIQCPAPGELTATGSFSRHAHPEDCRQYFVCLDGVAREYGCPIGTVFQIGQEDGLGQCADPENVPGCADYYGDLDLTALRRSQLLLGNVGLLDAQGGSAPVAPAPRPRRPVAAAAAQPADAAEDEAALQA
ncbi:protein obstructor-E isoform X1 [Macrobrachium rosenbergii]|uniref:protein obstructor-E isoform X1 n=1 Tax=Macrobrachium rosenbergii TaxID=79674 RepID=UPI0034D42489